MHEFARSSSVYVAEKLSLSENRANEWFWAKKPDMLRMT